MGNRLLPTALLQEGGAWTQPSEQRQSLACGGLTPVLWSWDLVLSPQLDPEAVSVSAGSQGPAPACPALTPEAVHGPTAAPVGPKSCSTFAKLGP